jgi:hypothetical protein
LPASLTQGSSFSKTAKFPVLCATSPHRERLLVRVSQPPSGAALGAASPMSAAPVPADALAPLASAAGGVEPPQAATAIKPPTRISVATA